jgi:hypothetical protein
LSFRFRACIMTAAIGNGPWGAVISVLSSSGLRCRDEHQGCTTDCEFAPEIPMLCHAAELCLERLCRNVDNLRRRVDHWIVTVNVMDEAGVPLLAVAVNVAVVPPGLLLPLPPQAAIQLHSAITSARHTAV